jgi:hypothetical protein
MNSAYVLLSFINATSAQEAYMDLYDTECVVYCDAVKGEYDLVLLIQGEDKNELNNIVKNRIEFIPGVKEICYLPIWGSKSSGFMNLSVSASSYVLLDVAENMKEKIFVSLFAEHQIASFDYVDGKYSAVLLIQGSSFVEIDHTIKTYIKSLDDVLRIKELPIIKLLEI